MSEQLKLYINLLKMQSTIFDKIVVTSSATLAGLKVSKFKTHHYWILEEG